MVLERDGGRLHSLGTEMFEFLRKPAYQAKILFLYIFVYNNFVRFENILLIAITSLLRSKDLRSSPVVGLRRTSR